MSRSMLSLDPQQSARELLEAVTYHASESIIILDQFGKIESYNPASERLFGYSSAQILGRNIQILIPEISYQAINTRQLKAPGAAPSQEVDARHTNGHHFLLQCSWSSFASQGEDYLCLTLRENVSAPSIHPNSQSFEEALTASKAEFERFIYVTSHDMQEPLRTLRSFSDILIEEYGGSLNGDGQTYLKLISDAAKRMQTMITDLLKYTRLNKNETDIVVFDSHKIASQIVKDFSSLESCPVIDVSCDRLPKLRGDPAQFSQLLYHIIGNGAKYQLKGNTPEILIQAQEEADYWQFSIKDNGIGIAHENLEKIFEPFKRLHGQHEYEGTGLGLAACRKIIQNHSGKIWCQSELEKGSLFSFTWPKDNLKEETNPLTLANKGNFV